MDIEEKTHPGFMCLLVEMRKRLLLAESGAAAPEPYALLATVAADLKAPAYSYGMAENALESYLSRDKTVEGVLDSLCDAYASEKRFVTAHHEAGHAVAAHVLGIPIRKVTIVEAGMSAGSVIAYWRNAGFKKAKAGVRLSRGEESYYLRCIDMVFAGGMAAQKHTGALRLDGSLGGRYASQDDLRHVVLCAGTVSGKLAEPKLLSHLLADPDVSQILEQAISRAAHWLANPLHWYMVTNLACDLMEHRTLTSKQIQAHCDRARVRHAELERNPLPRHTFGLEGIPE